MQSMEFRISNSHTLITWSVVRFLLLDDATRLVLIDKAVLGESLDDIIFSFLLLFLLLTFSFSTDHLLDVRGGFLR